MHYYTFHPKDYMSKTNFLEPMEDLAYRRMLDYQYLHESPLPADIDEIAMLINMRTHSDSIAVVLRYFFELTDDGYINDRAEQEIAKYQEKSEKARKSANARWKKKTPKANKDKGSSDVDANALRTDSEGNANQEPLTTNQEPLTTNQEPLTTNQNTAKGDVKKTKFNPFEYEIPSFIDKELWQAYHEMREMIKKPATETACKRLVSKLTKWNEKGLNVNPAIEASLIANWTDVYEEKAVSTSQPTNQKTNSNVPHWQQTYVPPTFTAADKQQTFTPDAEQQQKMQADFKRAKAELLL